MVSRISDIDVTTQFTDVCICFQYCNLTRQNVRQSQKEKTRFIFILVFISGIHVFSRVFLVPHLHVIRFESSIFPLINALKFLPSPLSSFSHPILPPYDSPNPVTEG